MNNSNHLKINITCYKINYQEKFTIYIIASINRYLNDDCEVI